MDVKKISRLMMAILGGLCLGFSFPPYQQSWMIFMAFVPLLVILDNVSSWKERFYWFWLAGTLGKFISFVWITHSAMVYGQLPAVVTWPLYLIYSILTGLHLPFIVLLSYLLVEKFHGKPNQMFKLNLLGWIWVGCGIALAEHITPTLFKWTFGNLAYINIYLIQFVDVVGSDGLSLFVFLINVWLFIVLKVGFKNRSYIKSLAFKDLLNKGLCRNTKLSWLVISIIIASVHIYGLIRYHQVNSYYEKSSNSMEIGTLQPNFSLDYLSSNRRLTEKDRVDSLFRILKMGDQFMKENPRPLDLLIWPESTFNFIYDHEPSVRQVLHDYVQKHNIDLLFTTQENEETSNPEVTRSYSSSYLLRFKDKTVEKYRKIFLIPFGEYIPLSSSIPWFAELLDKYISHLSQFTAGHEFTVLTTSHGKKISTTVCYDILDAYISRHMSVNGASIIINQSNFAWFGEGGAPGSVLQLLRFRGIEARIPTVMVANSGESVIMSATGDYLTPITSLFTIDSQRFSLPIYEVFSFYRYAGDLFVYVASILFILQLLLAWKAQFKRNLQ